MILRSFRSAGAVALFALSLSLLSASAQQQVPAAPPQDSTAVPAAPAAPAPTAAPTFPKPDPANFTAAAPSKDAINAFLQASWGYDTNRVWQIQAIMKTPADGVSKVVVLVGDKSGKQKSGALAFFAMPDGKHIVAGDEVLPFGEHPYADYRAQVQQGADGPYRGSAAKDLELVEFADFQCPHCKEAQANMDKLATDFPKARIVFQNYPLAAIHPASVKAAQYAVCVTKLGGSGAFFQFASAVFDGQEGLATPDGTDLTLNSAVTKAGVDTAKVKTCIAAPETTTQVESSVKLAQALNINQTPTLVVNGRQVPIGGVPYETLKQIVEYQAKLDGVAAQ
ncbi:MAG TPA: thioredoxin domain-containing protein [Terracidiphilus sp.]|nr:thioredoxin domain-containing protein [Terracidiphilus sp.]